MQNWTKVKISQGKKYEQNPTVKEGCIRPNSQTPGALFSPLSHSQMNGVKSRQESVLSHSLPSFVLASQAPHSSQLSISLTEERPHLSIVNQAETYQLLASGTRGNPDYDKETVQRIGKVKKKRLSLSPFLSASAHTPTFTLKGLWYGEMHWPAPKWSCPNTTRTGQ